MRLMDMLQIKVKLTSPGDLARFFEKDFWVYSAALYTFAPDDRLAALRRSPP